MAEEPLRPARPSTAEPHRTYAFGPFVADLRTRRLWRDGQPVTITAKTFHVLAVLLEHRNRIVSKDELMDQVWPSTAVQENNLARQISSLRRALGQRPNEADYILTIPSQGYRFVGDVDEIDELPGGPPATHVGHDPASPAPAGLEPPGDDTRADEAGPTTAPLAVTDVASPDASPPASLLRWSAVLAGLGVVALALAIGAIVFQFARHDEHARRTLQRLTFDDAGVAREASWAPDGQSIVFVSDRGGRTDLWKQRIGEPDPVRLTSSEAVESRPEWSPDGRLIAFRSEQGGGGIFIIPADGGEERMLSEFGYEPRWSPDSTRILFKRSIVLPDVPAFYVMGLDGRPPQLVRPDVLGQFTSLQAAWHPDGRRVSIWGTGPDGDPRFLNVSLENDDATPSRLSPSVARNLAGITPQRFVWSRSGTHLFFEGSTADSRSVWRITANPAAEWLTDGPVRMTTGTGQETSFAISPDGKRMLIASSTTRTRLWAFPLDGAGERIVAEPAPITEGSTGEVDFDARADGSKVAYRAVRAGRNELWERSLAEGRERLLLSSPERKLVKPRWSPDGARLAFLRCDVGSRVPVLAVLNADGSGERTLTKPGEIEMLASDWSSSGESILGSCRFNQSERYSTCLLPVSDATDSGRVRVIASDPKRNLFNQRFSPDQRWITFLAHDLTYNTTSTVYVIPATGGTWRAITDGSAFDDKPRWGPDGRVLYYVSTRDGVKNVWARRFDDRAGVPIGEPFPLTSFRSERFRISPQAVQMDIAVTTTRLIVPMSESRGDIWMLDDVDR